MIVFDVNWWDLIAYGTMRSDDGFTMEYEPIFGDLNGTIPPSINLYGNSTRAQGIAQTYTLNVLTLPYTYYYARNDGAGTVAGYPGCQGDLTQLDIWVYSVPTAPPATTLFDTQIFACVGDIALTDDLNTPVTNNPDVLYKWYTNASGGTSFASDDIEYGDLPNTGMSAFDKDMPGTYTYYVSQTDKSKDASTSSAVTSTFVGCESTTRTAVTIQIYDLPTEPVIEVRSIAADPMTELPTKTSQGNADYQFILCEGEINATTAFLANPGAPVAMTDRYNWYNAQATGAFNAATDLIGTFNSTATAQNLGLVGAAAGSNFFAVVKTENIITGEFTGCESAATIFEVLIEPIPGTPSFSDNSFAVCQNNDFDVTNQFDPGLTPGGTYNWYATQASIGVSMPIFTGENPDPLTHLSWNNTVAGITTYYVTEVDDQDTDANPDFLGCETEPLNALEITIEVTALPTPSIAQEERDLRPLTNSVSMMQI